MMQPIVLPAIVFMLFHLFVVPGIVGVGSKQDKFSLYFQKKQNKLDSKWLQIKIKNAHLQHTTTLFRIMRAVNKCET